ncbi:MAG: Hsp20/alpha crystallin family protein [Deltaproteobacteria bacterium]
MPQSRESTHESPSDKLRDVVAGWIDMVASQGERAVDAVGLRFPGRPWLPAVDVLETDDQVVVHVDLPGIDPETAEILLTGNMLTVKGDSPAAPLGKGETRHRHERPAGPFSRSIPLPVAVNPEKVSAESKNGVLTVTLAKEERVKPRHIPIGVKSSGSPVS